MQNLNAILKTVLVLLSLSFMQCASTQAPSGWLPDPEMVTLDPYGGWIDVRLYRADAVVSGEFIAVTRDTIFVADPNLRAIALNDIRELRLMVYDANNLMPLGTIVGTVSTVSNGFFLIFTAPMWLIGGSAASISRAYDPVIDYPKVPLESLAKYARYPQGLPPDLNRETIKMKTL